MAINKRLLVKPPSTGITPSEHFGVVLYEGDGSSSHSINGGKFGAAFYGNGSSSKIDIGNLNLGGDAERTISAWINTNSLSSTQTIFQYGANSNGARFGFSIDTSGKPFVEYYNRDVTTSSSHISANTWYHLVVTYNGNAIETATNTQIYVNGSAVSMTTSGAQTGSANTTDSNYGIGYDRLNTRQYFSGKLDQVRIFQKALSSSEVSTLYTETAATVESLDPLNVDTTDTLQVLGDTSCTALYRFENNEDDKSGNFNGTGTEIQYAAGRYGQAASFSGSDGCIINFGAGGIQATSSVSNSFSISWWMKTTTTTEQKALFNTYGNASGAFGFTLEMKGSGGGQIKLFTNYGGSDVNSGFTSNSYNDGNWHNFVLVKDVSGSSMKLYADKEEVLNITISTSAHVGNPLVFGNYTNHDSSTYKYTGLLDQARTFNKAISTSEIATLYNENPLVASYRFEGNASDDMRNYNGTASNVTYEYGFGFTPDLVWIKDRGADGYHAVHDSTRGATKGVFTNVTAAEYTGLVTSLDTGGFTVNHTKGGSNNNTTNRDGGDFVAWCWKANGGTTSSNTDGSITTTVQANQDSGFSIIKYDMTVTTSTAFTLGHGLSSPPEFIMFFTLNQSGSTSNIVYPNSPFKELAIDSNGGGSSSSAYWNNTAPSSTVINMGTAWGQYHSYYGGDTIAYAFHSVEGFSKIGFYTGNGSATSPPIIETGFEPAFVMIKNQENGSTSWAIADNKRGFADLYANLDDAEFSSGSLYGAHFLSNGFTLNTSDISRNANNIKYLYMAFAADPDTEQPTLASSFNVKTYTGTGSAQTISGLGFSPNLVVLKHRNNGTAHQWNWLDTVRTNGHTIHSNSDAASEAGTNMISSYTSDGFILGTDNAVSQSGINHVAWAWKADDNEETIEEVTEDADSIAIYKFEDDVDDVTGNYNGAATNITYATGKFNKAAEFNGSSSYIAISSLNTFLASDSNKSWSAWFKTSRSSGSNMGIVSDYGANGNYNFDTYLIPGTGKVQLVTNRGGSSQNSLTSGAYNDGNWHHAAVTQNMSTGKTKLYIDSVLQFTLDSGTGSGQDGPLYIGSYTAGTGKYNWDGLIDQVRIYNKELNAASIINLYNETTAQNDTLNIGTKATVSEQSIVSANANAGMSIVKYKGNGVVGAKIPHGLSASPDFILTKNLEESRDWRVFHSDLSTNQFLALNTSGAVGTAPANTCCGAVTSVSATTFGFVAGNGGATELDNVNKSGINYVSYCFHDVAAYQKFGSFTGTGTGTNQLINTGFQPDWVMFKDYSAGGSWWIQDSVRGSSLSLKANSTNTESTTNYVTFESNGFRVSGDANGTSSWIYWAIKIN